MARQLWLAHRSRCFDGLFAFEKERASHCESEVGDLEARLSRDQNLFKEGSESLENFLAFIHSNTKLESALIGAHQETRAVLLESNIGYSIVFGKRFGKRSPLGEMLLATHQLDWRLGERAIAFSRLSENVHGALRETLDEYRQKGRAAIGAAEKCKKELEKAEEGVIRARNDLVEARMSRSDMWQRENTYRIVVRDRSQTQQRLGNRIAECESAIKSLEVFRSDRLREARRIFGQMAQLYRDDMCRVGERLVKCGRSDFFKYPDDVERLEVASETREEFEERQAKIDATARNRGALVFPQFSDTMTPFRQRQEDGNDKNKDEEDLVVAFQFKTPQPPRSSLVAKKGVLEYEKMLGDVFVFCVLTFDGFLHGFPGRTEGAVEHESCLFSLDLSASQVTEEEEGPVIMIHTHSSTFSLSKKVTHKLKCKDAAEKYNWLKALGDPLSLFDDDDDSNNILDEAQKKLQVDDSKSHPSFV